MEKSFLRLIGDCHNRHKDYLKLLEGCRYSVQLGDFGFDYSCLDNISLSHTVVLGNHDRYDKPHPNHLGDFGIHSIGDLDLFYVRGAFSIDWKLRVSHEHTTGQKCWWPQEELSRQDMESALKMYKEIKPDYVITHTCPDSIAKMVLPIENVKYWGYDPKTFTTNTQRLFQAMFEFHKPEWWVFAHLHRHFDEVVKGTRFICLPELAYVDINEKGQVL